MKQRVQQLLNMDCSSMSVGTFHSISARILRREIHLLDYSNDFVIYDQEDSRALVKKMIFDLELDEKSFVPKAVQNQISNAKNKMISPEFMASTVEGFMDEKISEIYSVYQKALKQNNALDFDDLLLKPLELFNDFPNRLEYYQNQFRYVLVDEYQDTNRPQFELIQALSKEHRDVCVVGDDDQSIYSWRGADVNNILNFVDVFGESQIIKLEQNYRSTKTILECAWTVVSKNSSRAEKKLWTENKQGDKLALFECRDERDESWKVLNTIRNETVQGDYDFNDLVILYRTNAQSRVVEDVLRREGVPYEIIGGIKFYARKEVKDILAYLRIIVNPSDGISFDRIVNFPPRGIGKTTLKKIHNLANENDYTYLRALGDFNFLSIGQKQKKALHEFNQLIHKYRTSYKEEAAASITRDLLADIDLQAYYENQNSQEALERWSNVQELVNSIADFHENRNENGLQEFLQEVSLLTDIDRWNESDKAVTLMTIHSAKGLEFPIVMIVGLEEGLFPLGPQSYETEELEEERRLFYVALTRAKEKVYLSYATARRRFGGMPTPAVQSRFIHELPEELVIGNNIDSDLKVEKLFRSSFAPSTSRSQQDPIFSVGDHVEHKLFGKGKILAVEGIGGNAKLTIVFSGNVRKKIIAKYANLTQYQVP
jgi:DNA helicase-2/ATP-dependent DNA helicase PcrA